MIVTVKHNKFLQVQTKQFRKLLEQLPPAIQEQADRAYKLWQTDPCLQFKRVSQRQPIYAVREWLSGSGSAGDRSDLLVWIGSHAEYDRLL